MLANDFGRLFTQKIDDIPLKLDSIDPHQISLTRSSVQEHSYTGTPFTNFEPISSESIRQKTGAECRKQDLRQWPYTFQDC